jgi:hypothetical protein
MRTLEEADGNKWRLPEQITTFLIADTDLFPATK